MPKTCDLAKTCPPYYPCTCAHKCDCECHGKQKPKTRKIIPSDPDAFNTTNRSFHKPFSPEDYSPKQFVPVDNLGSNPNILPLSTEMKREYTPKKADRESPTKPRSWRQSQPFDPSTTSRDTFKAPSPTDYPARVGAPKSEPRGNGPGQYGTTTRNSYVRPDPDMYSSPVGGKQRDYRASPPGIFDTEYGTQYVPLPLERSSPFKSTPVSLGDRPTDFSTTTRGAYRPPTAADYPTRERGYKPKAGVPQPMTRMSSTSRETYRDPGPSDDPVGYVKPRDTPLHLGPTSPMESTTHADYGPKAHFCCGCSSN